MAVGNQTPVDTATDFAVQRFVVQQMISKLSTMTLARVIDCTNDGGVIPVGTLTVQLMVNMVSGDAQAFEHAPIYKVPYLRLQGGSNAVIIDPEPGDIGLVGFCERDISAVKKSRAVSNPGSARQYSKSDGVWVATVWAANAPTQYVVMNSEGITLVSPNGITLQAPTIILDGAVQATSTIDAADNISAPDVISGTISGATHTHGGVTVGGAATLGPNP